MLYLIYLRIFLLITGITFTQDFYQDLAYEETQRQSSAAADYVFPDILGRITGVNDGLNLRSLPGADATVLASLRPYEAITIHSYIEGGWYEATTREGLKGYLASRYISLEAEAQKNSKAQIYDSPGGEAVMFLEAISRPQIQGFEVHNGSGWYKVYRENAPNLYLAYEQVKMISAQDIYIAKVPKIHQRGKDPISGKALERGHVHCGPTAFQIVYHFHKKMLDRQSIVDAIYAAPGAWEGFEGGMIPRLAVKFSQDLGFADTIWNTNTNFLTLKKNLMEGRPQIVAVIGQIYTYVNGSKESYYSVTGHHIVLKGIRSNGDLVFSDPNRVTSNEFNNSESDFHDAQGRQYDAVMRSEDFFKAWMEGSQAWSYDVKSAD